MTAKHHPSDETLLRAAAGTLSAGPSLVVRAHCDMCAACAHRLARFEAVGGVLLDQQPPASMADGALNAVLAAIDRAAPPRFPATASTISLGLPYPRSLSRARIGRLRWLAPGFRRSRVALPEDPAARVMLMYIGAGRSMPEHGHTGIEYTLVLSGSFSDELGHYGPGDFIELDSSVEHQPIVGDDDECVCLAALEGEMRFSGYIGRVIQRVLPL